MPQRAPLGTHPKPSGDKCTLSKPPQERTLSRQGINMPLAGPLKIQIFLLLKNSGTNSFKRGDNCKSIILNKGGKVRV